MSIYGLTAKIWGPKWPATTTCIVNEIANLLAPSVLLRSDPDRKDWDGFEEGRGHFLKRRQLVGDYMGAQELTEWLKQGFPLWRLDGPASEFDGTSAPFEGKWSSRKRNNPGLVAELLEFTVCRTEEKSRFRLKLSEDGEPASVQCSDAMLVTPVKLTFTVRDDTTVARGECVLSLDARHMRLALSHTNGMPWRSLVLSRAVE